MMQSNDADLENYLVLVTKDKGGHIEGFLLLKVTTFK